MKTSTGLHTLVTARIGLSIAALALAGCAADDLTHKLEVAALSAPTMTTRSSGATEPCTGRQSYTLLVEGTDGNEVRLVHVSGCGWKQVADEKSGESSLALPKMSLSPVVASHAETTSTTGDDPMTVFIDGPTGYTFVWTAEGGWKFVGYLSDGAR